jgi:hypothetical protein
MIMNTMHHIINLSRWLDIYAHNLGFLRPKLKVFTFESGDASISVPHARLLGLP